MRLQEAIAQYADMVTLGAQALERISERDLDERQQELLSELVRGIVERAAGLRGLKCAKLDGQS